MWKYFTAESPVGRVLTRVVDLVILNVLYILFCLPVFTIGAATSALYYCTVRMADGTFISALRDFWRGFKDNFRAVTPVSLAALVYAAFVAVEFWMNWNGAWGGRLALWIYIILAVVFAVTLLFCEWVFALQMRFENPRRVLLKNAALFTFRYLPSLLVIDALNLVFLLLVFSDIAVWPVTFLCAFSLPAFLKGKYFSRIFNHLISILQPDALPTDPIEDEKKWLAELEEENASNSTVVGERENS